MNMTLIKEQVHADAIAIPYCIAVIGHIAFNEEMNRGIEFYTYDREGENETNVDLERYDMVSVWHA